jgi:chromosome partitioning protein
LEVGVLDTDVQGSLTGIADELVGINFIPAEELANIGSLTLDILIIDTPPYLTDTLSDLYSISDYVLMPSKTGFFDILAIKATLGIIRKVQEQHPDLKYGVVLNMLKSSTSLTDDIIGILKSYDANILKTRIYDRVAYMRSSITNGVFSTDDTKAHDEILSLTDEILSSF